MICGVVAAVPPFCALCLMGVISNAVRSQHGTRRPESAASWAASGSTDSALDSFNSTYFLGPCCFRVTVMRIRQICRDQRFVAIYAADNLDRMGALWRAGALSR